MQLARCLVVASMLVAGCSSDDDGRVTIDELTDVITEGEDLPEDVVGVDLEELAPSGDVDFCEAAGTAPARWLTDAVAPIQFWVDAFSQVDDAPPAAEDAIDELLEFGERRLSWHFGRLDERPEWTSAHAEHAVAVFDAALDACDDLPLVVHLEGASNTPRGWAELTDSEVADRCAQFARDVTEGIDWFTELTGEAPRHQQQIELANDLAWRRAIDESGELPDDVPLYTSSDFIGVGADGRPTPVPGGACAP